MLNEADLFNALAALEDKGWIERITKYDAKASGWVAKLEPRVPQSNYEGYPILTDDSGFVFGRKSKAELEGVKPELVAVAGLALKYSTQDFMIYDGLRTIEEQKSYVAKGTSKTMKSKHLKQADGFSHAFDAVPVVKALPKWDWKLIFPIVAAVDRAATELGYADKIRWGGAWDRTLADFGGKLEDYERETQLYAQRNPGKDFLDGPHFEWVD